MHYSKIEFAVANDLDFNDFMTSSLLFYSEEELAYIKIGNIYMSLMVRGEVTIDYKDERYKNYGQYSEELKQLLRGELDDIWKNEDLCIIDNNWFQIEICKIIENQNGEEELHFLFEDCDNADFEFDKDSEKSYVEQLFSQMLGLLQMYKDNKWVEELKDLDLDSI